MTCLHVARTCAVTQSSEAVFLLGFFLVGAGVKQKKQCKTTRLHDVFNWYTPVRLIGSGTLAHMGLAKRELTLLTYVLANIISTNKISLAVRPVIDIYIGMLKKNFEHLHDVQRITYRSKSLSPFEF